LAYLFITHNLAVVSYLAHRVAVMRAGRIVETGAAEQVLTQPRNAYTRLLLDSVPGKSRAEPPKSAEIQPAERGWSAWSLASAARRSRSSWRMAAIFTL
jgi:ABC-type dipeptide/oligopeptide/nickel transport system ATPase component